MLASESMIKFITHNSMHPTNRAKKYILPCFAVQSQMPAVLGHVVIPHTVSYSILNVAAFAPACDCDFRFQVIGCAYPLPSPLRIFLWCEVQCRVINARYHEYQMAMMPQLSDYATQADLHVSEFC